MSSKHPFPYTNFDQVIQDKATKLGAPGSEWKEELMSLLSIGWYQKQERKVQNERKKRDAEIAEQVLERARRDPKLREQFAEFLESKKTA